jgi:hypothetical protein
MDPNATLQRIRELLLDIPIRPVELDYWAEDIGSAFIDLDNWLKQGGFPPDDWQSVIAIPLYKEATDILRARIMNVLELSEALCCDSESDRLELCNRLVKEILP